MFKNKRIVLVLSLVFMILCSGCVKNISQKKQVVVFAAASLSDVIMEFKESYEKEHEDTELVINLAGSKTLRSQLENGAECDIFISANEKHYKALEKIEIARDGEGFLRNSMVLVVPKDNPAEINSMEDLKKEHSLVLAQENVPAGDYARAVLDKFSKEFGEDYKEEVLKNLVSNESNVRQVLSKVILGEADAAIVYKTDVTGKSEDKLKTIEIPEEFNVTGTYSISYINKDDKDSCEEEVLRCCEFLKSDDCCELFEKYGFDFINEVK